MLFRLIQIHTFTALIFALVSSTAIAEEDPAVVIVFGDSISAGFSFEGNDLSDPPESNSSKGIGSGETDFGLPDQLLRNYLNESRRKSIVVNWGYGGSSSTFGEMRISGNTAQTKGEHAGSQYIIVIMYGTNDSGQGISPSTTGFNIGQMIVRARLNDYIPVIGSLIPRDDENVVPYNDQIRSAALSANALYVDHFSNYQNVAPPDGFDLLTTEFSNLKRKNVRVHPTNEGYEVIAQHWIDAALANLIEQYPPAIAPILMLLLDE